MKLKTKQLSLNNVVGFNTSLESAHDIFKQVAEIGMQFKELLIQNDFYGDGPIIFEYNPFIEGNELTIFSSVGNKVNLVGENKSEFFFQEHLNFTTDYFYRHYDQEEVIPYSKLQEKIEADQAILLGIYHVLLNLAGDTVIDIYCEVDKL